MRASGDLKESNAKMIRIRDVTSRRPEKLVLGSLRPVNGTESPKDESGIQKTAINNSIHDSSNVK